MTAEINFVRQQGFRDASPAVCGYRYPALMWQPRLIGSLVVLGVVLESWPWFVALAALLLWSAALPRLSPFDALYNCVLAQPVAQLGPAPAPRRFAQAMAGAWMLAIALCLGFSWSVAAAALEGLLVAALAAFFFGRSCMASYLFPLFRGETGLARGTLPWARSE